MKKILTLLVIVLFCRPCYPQVIKSFTHPMGYGLSATATRLIHNGYLVASEYSDGVVSTNYVTSYHNDGTVNWTKSENSGLLAGVMDMVQNSRQELYFLAEDISKDQYYGLIKTDSTGNLLWSVNLDKKGYITYESPKICVNNADEVYVMSSTYEKTNIYKVDDNGNLLWSKTIEVDTVSTKNPAFDIITTPDGGVIYSGKAGNDIFMQRLASNGTVLWTKQLFEYDQAYSHPKALLALNDGNYLLAGFRGENTGAYSSGLFIIKMDGNGILQEYKFYYDSLAVSGFIPHAAYETTDGHIHIMGCGGVVTFADFDANLNLERYSVWNGVGNLLISAGGFDYQKDQLIITGTDNNTTQYILRNNVVNGEDFCDQQDLTTMTTRNLPIDNALYVASPVIGNGPVAVPATYTLNNPGDFVTSPVCGQNEFSLGTAETTVNDLVNVYPNPVSAGQSLNLNLSWDDETNVMLTNASGQVVLQQAGKGHQQLNTGGLPAGMYVLNLSVNDKTRYTSKVIVY